MKYQKTAMLLPLLLAVYLIFTPTVAAAAAAPFGDVESHWAAADIESLYDKGVYKGMIFEESALFKPEQPVTRAEFLLMLFNAMGLDLTTRDQTLTAPFTDYEEAPEAYRPYLIEGYRRGILLGKNLPDGSLVSGWNDTLTRQESAAFVGRILNARSNHELTFTDGGVVAAWARDYLSALADKGVFGGLPDGSFAPLKNLSRAEASRIVYQLTVRRLFIATEIRVYAGSTDLGAAGGARLVASFGTPFGLTTGASGTLLVADKDANLLRRITSAEVSLLAGQTVEADINGLPRGGYRDMVSTTEIMMRGPRYLTHASDGVIYYTDGGNHALRMITTDGKGYTVAGNGKAGYVNGARDKTEFNLPSGVAVGAGGAIYVADTLNNCIRTVAKDGTSTLFAGVPGGEGGYRDGAASEAQFCQPTDIHLGADGALYIADTGNSMVRVIKNGQVTTLAGGATAREELSGAMLGGYQDGAASDALFRGPLGLFVTASGVVFVADTENNVIRKIEAGYVTTVAGNLKAGNSTGPALVSMLNGPVDVVFLNGRLYVSDSNNHCIKVFGTDLED